MDRNEIKAAIQYECYRLKIGECICFDRFFFQDGFRAGFPTIYNTIKEAFLSSMIGSSWGVWTIEENPENGNYTICRHKESKNRYYVDPDRRHLFKRNPDGTLERR